MNISQERHPNLLSRNRLTLIVLLTLSSGYFVYLFGVRVVLRAVPPDITRNSRPIDDVDPGIESFDESSRIAAKHLPDQEWARDATVQLRDGDTLFYYAQKWSQSEEKRSVTFEPLALVWFQEGADEPLVVQAESALVTFERDVDLSSPDPGRIVAGELLGDVTIRGEDSLAVKGHHFIFSEESGSIFSDNPVEFSWQKHSGSSQQGIQIDLDMATGGQTNQLAVTGVREVHLTRNVAMNFLFEQDNDVIPLSVRCAGRFMLRLLGETEDPASRSIATFEDKVVVTRATELNTSDVLTCDQLDLHLEEATEAEKAASKLGRVAGAQPGIMPGSNDSSIKFRRMRAKGYVVKVTSELNEFQAVVGSENQQQRSMAVVDYDATARRLMLNDFDPNLARQWKPRVRITQKSGEMDCQQISVTHHADGRVNEVVCLGHGWLAYRKPGIDGAPATDVLLADWKRQLRKFTDSTTGQDVIDLFGEAVVKMPEDESGISADYIKIWTDPIESTSTEEDSSLFAIGNSKVEEDDQPKQTPNPRRILAQKNVLLISPRMHGQMEELQVWFEDADPPADSSKSKDELTPVSYRVPESAAPLLLPDEVDDSQKLKEPVFVSADLTRIRIVRHGDDVDPEVREVWTEGDVRITQHRESADGPVVMTGDRLHILSNSPDAQMVHIIGQPAQLLEPRMKLTGEEISFDRARNLAWTDGASELKLPVERDFDGKKLEKPTELTIHSHEQMSFDGRAATFIGRVHASMHDSVMRCQQMEVTMLKPLVFDDRMKPSERPEIATVTCQFNVEFNSHVIEEGTLKEVRRAKFARFHLDHRTGKVIADNGPGTVSLWRRGRGKRAGLAPLAAAGANRAMDAQGTEWEYSRIKFARDMSGNVKERTTTFRGQIEVIYGPVDEPMVKIDLDKLPKDGGAMFCDWLEFVQREPTEGRKHVELLAKENARLEGRSFFAQADEISYDESKGLYMLRSSGDESILWREKVAGGERTAVVAETFRFIPSINKVEFDKASRVQGLQ
ncbi:MAG: hypothetical protein ACI92S_001810 [Planctomycetaceae bacterium]